ncbi:oxygenase MpaB family protein [Nocardia mexicana]|uniref:Uncharacterized protein (DUF2236 family) n=1 Tax=Nocardia mexicana TaxID=279262 RepID=A0A370H1M6_9NOCA|nr:oxygenase MpaB family protein [Nocardia mexicana]RDI49916.1 uncharacterized protein (DUF2236 family) [Nocardia mexicana]
MTTAQHEEMPAGPGGDPVGAPLGPGSLTWRYFGDRRVLLYLGRSGTLQNMHPAVGQALQDHSDFFADPWDRLFRSLPPIFGVVYDSPEDGTGPQVRDYHRGIKGRHADGRRYHALDPDVFWWTHVTFFEFIIAVNEHFGTPLTREQKDQVVAEAVTWWQRYGLSMRPAFSTYAEFETYWQHMLSEVLESNPTTDFAMTIEGRPIPPLPGVPAPIWALIQRPVMRFNVWLATALFPGRAREILGLTWTDSDERRFRLFADVIRRTWPLLPDRLRYTRRAYAGIRRAARTGQVTAA